MSTEDEDLKIPYMFNRNFRSAIRLNYNHWLMKELTGWLLHPVIPRNTHELRVADVGTGTAIWPSELAAQLATTTELDGFDISPSQFPPANSLPSNVHLHVHDCFKPFPPEFHAAFDIVHARFWLCLVNDSDAPVLLERLVSLLKPGGYIQWFEPLPLATATVQPSTSASNQRNTSAVDRLTKQWHKPKPTSTYNWVEDLPEHFRRTGLQVLARDRFPLYDRYRLIWAHSQLAGLEDLSSDVKLLGVEKSDEIKRWIIQLSDEFANGVSVDTPFFCVVGRKA